MPSGRGVDDRKVLRMLRENRSERASDKVAKHRRIRSSIETEQCASLKDQLQRKLKLPRIQGQIRSRDLAKPARPKDRRGTRSTSPNAGKSRAPLRDGDIGLPKVHGVGDIVNLCPWNVRFHCMM